MNQTTYLNSIKNHDYADDALQHSRYTTLSKLVSNRSQEVDHKSDDPHKSQEQIMNTSISSNGISSFDIRSMMFASSHNGEDHGEGTPDYMLANAYSQAAKVGIDKKHQRYLSLYHKCLFALIKVMTKRMKLFYQGNIKTQEECDEIEHRFSIVMEKIVRKMKQIEDEAN